jgi:precorrin-2 dehydrogenase/sirohydrochlorin ferrochelatase
MTSLYPVFLRLEGRPCLVVGGGEVAAGKIAQLLEAGARLRIVAPEHCDALNPILRGRRGPDPENRPASPELFHRPFAEHDLDGMELVIAATNDRELNRRISELARGRGLLVNAVDDPPACSFFAPAIVRRGDLQIAISTNGESPLLAQWIRRRLERFFSPRWAEYVQWLGEARRRAHARLDQAFAQRVDRLRALMSDETMELLLSGSETEFKERMARWSASSET